MMRASLAFLTAALLFSPPASAQAPGAPDDFQFSGTVGPYRIGMDLIIENNKVASGYYFYVSKLTDIKVEPRAEHDPVTLAGSDGSIFRLHFVGNGSEHGEPLNFGNSVALQGSWTEGSKTLPARLDIDGASGSGIPGHRYALITKASDAVVEGHARRFLTAVLSGDRNAAAAAVDYPLHVNGPGGSHLVIRDKAAFLADWDKIFTPKYVAVLRTAVPHDMFVRDEGAMVAHGAVWFQANGASELNLDVPD